MHISLRKVDKEGDCQLRTVFRFAVIIVLITLIIPGVPSEASVDRQIVINKVTNQLAYFEGDELVKVFPVGTGKKASYTPEGNFKVVSKLVNPYYRAKNIPGGDPQNPLGVRWLGLNAGGTKGDVYGIHGNNNPDSIGKYVSLGCIRMYNRDVIWLFDRVPLGTPVSIINSNADFGTVAGRSVKEPELTVMVNGTPLQQRTYLEEGTSYAPLRELARSVGARVVWESKTKTAYVYGKKTLTFLPGGPTSVNGQEAESVRTKLVGNKLYVPVRFMVTALGGTVAWDEDKAIVNVYYPATWFVERSFLNEMQETVTIAQK